MKLFSAKYVAFVVCLALFLIGGCGESKPAPQNSSAGQNSSRQNASPNGKGRADRIFLGDHILTLDDTHADASALAIAGDKILWLGKRADASQWRSADTITTELGERALLPGFIDAHGHLSFMAQTINFANVASPPVGPVGTITALQNVLRRYIAERAFAPGEWVIGMGYDDSLLQEQRHPNRDDLDAVTRRHPLALIHVSGHLAAVNSMALQEMAITAQTPDPRGGVIRRRTNSREPNGVLEETAARQLQRRVLAPSKNPAADVAKALDTYASFGITTVQDGASSLKIYQMFRTLTSQKPFKLDVVVYALVNDEEIEPPSGVDTRHYIDRVKLGGVKLVLDGSPQGKTAYLSKPYLIPPAGKNASYRGYPTLSQKQVDARVAHYLGEGIQLLAHANGDAAADMLIDAIAAAARKKPLGDHRTVMIHAQTVTEDQLDRMQTFGIIPSFFSAHSYYWGDWYLDSVLGKPRALRISPSRSALQRGMPFTIHNDAPVVPPDMIRLIWATVNRITRAGRILGQDQRIPALAAIRATTSNAAYQYFEESTKGTLTPGKLADLVILSQDPTIVEPQEIINIRVLETISHGRSVYVRGP